MNYKVLVLLDSTLTSSGSPPVYSTRDTYTQIIQTLDRLGVPWEQRWTADTPLTMAANYDLVILPYVITLDVGTYGAAPAGGSRYPEWINGDAATTVFVAHGAWLVNSGSIYSGATGRTNGTACIGTSQWGDIGILNTSYKYALSGAGITNLIYDAADSNKSMFWSRQGTGGKVYFWTSKAYSILGLLHVIGVVYGSKYAFPIFVDIDHPDDANDATSLAGLEAFCDWLRARSTQVVAGIKRCSTTAEAAEMSAAMVALLNGNRDVLLGMPHSHRTVGDVNPNALWFDDSSYGPILYPDFGNRLNSFDSVAAKIAEYEAEVAVLAAAGVKCCPAADLPWLNLPWHIISMMGIQAAAAMGVRAYRTGSAVTTTPYAAGDGNIHQRARTIVDVDGTPTTVYAVVHAIAAVSKADAIAEEQAAVSPANDLTYKGLYMHHMFGKMLRENAPILMFHGGNFKITDAGSQSAAMYFLESFDRIVNLSGGSVRWGTLKDAYALASW